VYDCVFVFVAGCVSGRTGEKAAGGAGEMGGKWLVIVQAGIGFPSHERVWSCFE
jgi:hypothetical protein